MTKAKIWFLITIFTLNACAPVPNATATPTATETYLAPLQTSIPAAPDCRSIEFVPTPAAQEASVFPPISAADRTRGPDSAAVKLMLYGDFQDQLTAQVMSILWQLEEKYPDDLQIIFRDFPLITNPGHEKAEYALRATHAAALQGKYWEMNDLFFAKQNEWSPLPVEEFEQWLAAEAINLSIDAVQLAEDMQREEIVAKVEQAFAEGVEIGLPGVPFVLINGQIYAAALLFEGLDQIVALIALGERQFTSCPPLVIDPEKEYLAILETEKGEVIIQFYPDVAPIAVNNFIFLAQEGWYDGVTFHRVLLDFFAETGDPSGTGKGNPGYFFQNEIDPSLTFDRPGVVAMKNIGAETNGSQFFITYDAVPSYNGKYTIFGQVISGMDILKQLSAHEQQFGESLPAGDLLLSVMIEER